MRHEADLEECELLAKEIMRDCKDARRNLKASRWMASNYDLGQIAENASTIRKKATKLLGESAKRSREARKAR